MTRAAATLVAALSMTPAALAFGIGGDNGVAFHGSVQADVLFPKEDDEIGTGKYDSDILFNTYADLNLISRHIDAGIRAEFIQIGRAHV